MTYASTVLTRELQRAVKNRTEGRPIPANSPQPPRPLIYTVSNQAREHLEKLRNYREQAKHVRIGIY